MSDRNREKIAEFKAIACDESLVDDQVRTYLSWGKGKVDVALNYYFNRIEKGRVEPITKKESKKENKPTHRQTVAEKKLREGAEKEKRTADYIKNLKEEYKLPLRTKDYHESMEKVPEEFAQVDYIPDVLYGTRQLAKVESESERKEAQNFSSKEEVVEKVSDFTPPAFQRASISTNNQPKEQFSKPKPVLQQTEKCSHEVMEVELTSQLSQPTKSKLSASNSSEAKVTSTRDLPENSDVYIGEFVVGCFAISRLFLKDCNENDEVAVSFVHLNKNAEVKTKKAAKRKVDEKVMMRVVWKEREIGRVQDSQTKFLNGLLDKHIRLQTSLIDKLEMLDHFKTFRVRAKVFLLKQSITVPIVETYENRADHNEVLDKFGDVREHLMALFSRLALVVSKQPLIRLKSKLNPTKTQSKPSALAASTTIIQNARIQPEKTLQQIHYETVNNPFRQVVQKNIADMFAGGKTGESNPARPLRQSVQNVEQEKKPVREVQIKPETFSELIDLHEEDLEQAEPSEIFVSKLHEYQSLALSWMLKREGQSSIKQEETLHPMWLEYELPERGHLYFNEFTGQVSAEPPIFKSKCKGGILADEMGLGKTVMLIALMATNRTANNKSAKNLIVLPLTLLEQWESEILLHTKPRSLRVLRYYETSDRNRSILDYDVVLTTYGVISQEFAQGNHITNTGLFKYQWHRVILDEAHYIKGRVIQTARAVFSLRSQINWCLTGTPIQNKLDDLFALLHFIRYTPWSDYQWWNSYINKPHEQGDPVVFEVLRTILKKVLLRRTKQSKKRNGQPIINLPEKVSKISYIELNSKERQFYDAVYEASKKEFDELANHGIIEAKFMKIFEILMRLRQICCHPALFRSVTKFSNKGDFPKELRKWLDKRLEERNAGEKGSRFEILMEEDGREVRLEVGAISCNEKRFQQVITRIDQNPNEMCSVCLDPMENPVITVCLHTYCRSCIVRSIESIGYCPECRNFLSRDDFTPLPRENRLGISLEKEFRPSTKMEALMNHLKQLKADEKAVVFSQFLGMIDLIEEHMRQEHITHVRMDGSLSQKERSSVIDRFKNDPSCQVFIISLKSGGVGLNLVAANKVFMVDPWWNPAVEEQAIERVHRIGQKKKVEVVRFIVENSIESRMMELHESKRNISAMAISERESKQTSIEKFRYLMSKY